MIRPDDRDAAVRDLLRQPRPAAVDAARAARVRPAVHAAWKDAADGTRNWKRGVAIAAAAVLVFAIALTLVNWLRERGAPQAAAPIASTLFVTSEVVFQHDGQARAGRVGEGLRPGTRITTNGGRAAIVLANGVELRLDSNTDITLDTERSMSLARGALYLDSSHRTGPPETVAIVARGTVIRDIGTRYEVRLSDQELRVRVRDGRVEVSSAFGMREADRGGQLRVTSSGILSGRASTSGADWDWIVRAMPAATARGPAAAGISCLGGAGRRAADSLCGSRVGTSERRDDRLRRDRTPHGGGGTRCRAAVLRARASHRRRRHHHCRGRRCERAERAKRK